MSASWCWSADPWRTCCWRLTRGFRWKWCSRWPRRWRSGRWIRILWCWWRARCRSLWSWRWSVRSRCLGSTVLRRWSWTGSPETSMTRGWGSSSWRWTTMHTRTSVEKRALSWLFTAVWTLPNSCPASARKNRRCFPRIWTLLSIYSILPICKVS